MAACRAQKTLVFPALAAVLLLAGGKCAAAQSPKPSIVPPSVKPSNLPDLDLFAPAQKQQTSKKPAPISDPMSQAGSTQSPPTGKTPIQGALPTRAPRQPTVETLPLPSKPQDLPQSPVKLPESSEAPTPELGAKPKGKAPEPLPTPAKHPKVIKATPPDPEAASPWDHVDENSLYRPLAAVVIEGEARRGGGEPLWQEIVQPAPLPRQIPWPDGVPAEEVFSTPVEERPDISSPISYGNASSSDHWLRVAPSSLLWQPPLANPREPRMSAKRLRVEGDDVFDAAIGGQFGLLRISPDQRPEEGFQLDVFAVAFARFGDDDLSALDFRFGIPLTYSDRCWQYKLAYEHTSSRFQGDPLVLDADQTSDFRREEIVIGAARSWWEILRAYGQIGMTFSGTAAQKDDPFRFDVGVEWADLRCTTPNGAPFAAIDLEARGDQDYEANVTIQAGWNWRGRIPGRGPRLCGEYHRGDSPFGQTFSRREDWYGVVACFDW